MSVIIWLAQNIATTVIIYLHWYKNGFIGPTPYIIIQRHSHVPSIFVLVHVCCKILSARRLQEWKMVWRCGYFNYGWTNIVQDDTKHAYTFIGKKFWALLHSEKTWFRIQQRKTNWSIDLPYFQLGGYKSKKWWGCFNCGWTYIVQDATIHVHTFREASQQFKSCESIKNRHCRTLFQLWRLPEKGVKIDHVQLKLCVVRKIGKCQCSRRFCG